MGMGEEGYTRRDFLKAVGFTAAAFALGDNAEAVPAEAARPSAKRPNVILCMTDDQGWGDTGYNGHKILKTPVLDEMAASGVRFDRFYAAAPVCSPTRGSVMTGRHPNRFGCFSYNYSIRPQEVTLAEALKGAGYATAHFGKWHLGPVKAASPVSPGGCGFDEWLSHDNYFDLNPQLSRNGAKPERFRGESSDIIVDAALQFIRKAAGAKRPFLTVVWFGSPHSPHRALPKDKLPYKELPERQQNYYGEIAAVDRAMGTLRRGIRKLGVADNTLLWFCSDNGSRRPGSAGGLRGGKATLWEGGIRVPGIIEWPGRIRNAFATNVPASTMDIYPTIVDLVGLTVPGQVKPIDGISLHDLIDGRMKKRPKPIPFWVYSRKEGETEDVLDAAALKGRWRTFKNYRYLKPRTENFGGWAALIDDRYKLHKRGRGGVQLYDLVADRGERRNVAREKPKVAANMKAALEACQASVERSLSGQDYPAAATKVTP